MARQTEPRKDSKQIVVELTMPLEEARQVIWQGRGVHDPMGQLIDAKQIDKGDLAWAVDCGFEPKFREAARTLLAYWLGQPATLEKTLQYGPQVIEGSHDLEDIERKNLIQASAFFGLTFGFIGIYLTMFVTNWIFDLFKHWGQGEYLGVVLALLFDVGCFAGAVWLLLRYIKQKYDTSKSFRTGREGEEKVVERLRSALDNRWTIFRNLHLPGHNDDIDVVLVGPAGVWAMEVKSSRSTVKIEGKKWELKVKGRWVSAQNNPSDQITVNAKLLNDFLKRQGITRWIECAIVLASSQPISNFDLSEIPVWLLPTIEEKVTNLSTRVPPTEKDIEQIVAIFKDLATKRIAIEEVKYK